MTEAILTAEPTGSTEAGQPGRAQFAVEGLAAHSLERTSTMPSVSLLHSVPPPAHDEHVTAVYRYAVGNGIAGLPTVAAELGLSVEQVDQAVAELVRHRLLRKDYADPRRLLAVDPEVAAMALVSPMERRSTSAVNSSPRSGSGPRCSGPTTPALACRPRPVPRSG